MNANFSHLINIIVLAIIMAGVDIFYLTAMTPFFNKLVVNIQGSSIKLNLYATLVVYLFLVLQLYYFILKDASNVTPLNIAFDSFILGISTYGVYEFTNKAIFKKWSYEATIYDTLWGGILFSITGVLYHYIKKNLKISILN